MKAEGIEDETGWKVAMMSSWGESAKRFLIYLTHQDEMMGLK
jgi:hypothetical protein